MNNILQDLDTQQSMKSAELILDNVKFEHENKCRVEFGLVGGTNVSHTKNNLVDLENDLIGLTRTSNKCSEFQYVPPEVTFNSVVTLPANDFQKITRDMNNLAEYVEIKNVNNEIILTCNGDFCTQETVLSDKENDSIQITSENRDDIIQGNFSLKYLVLFTKCTNLSNTVELYLKNDYPLIIKYTVASLGNIKLCLTPQIEAS